MTKKKKETSINTINNINVVTQEKIIFSSSSKRYKQTHAEAEDVPTPTCVIFHDAGGDDVDDEMALRLAAVAAHKNKEKLIIVTGGSIRVSYDRSFISVEQVLVDLPKDIYEIVKYEDWIVGANDMENKKHFRSLLLISPQTTPVQDGLSKSWPAFSFDMVVLQGNAVGLAGRPIVTPTDSEKDARNGANYYGNEDLIIRFNDQKILSVVPTGLCSKFRLNIGQIRRLPENLQLSIVANAFLQLTSRIPSEHVKARDLILGANYNLIGSTLAMLHSVDIDTIDPESIPTGAKNMADTYLEEVSNAETVTVGAEKIEETRLKLYRMCIALNKIIPNIWQGTEKLYSGMSREMVEQKFGDKVTTFIESLLTREDTEMAPIPPCYDLLTEAWRQKLVRYADLGRDPSELYTYECMNSMESDFNQIGEDYVDAVNTVPTSAASDDDLVSSLSSLSRGM